MRFAHLADCHIGGWRDSRMKNLPLLAFSKAVDICMEENLDFVLISGDLFNTSHPDIDSLKTVVSKLRELKENNISVYMIAGSHDFSSTGKTILDVIEEARLAKNVARGKVLDTKLMLKFTIDKKTGAKITGMPGKKGMLEKNFYLSLDKRNLESEKGFKIFMFHTALTELKPKYLEKMDSAPISLLPKNFDYYAGGHIHIVEKKNIDGYKNIVYPGPIFPNNFRELEILKNGGFYIYDDGEITYREIPLYDVISISISADNKTSEKITNELMDITSEKDFKKKIVLIRIIGELTSGKVSDIDFRRVLNRIYSKGAYFIMKNTYKLKTKEFEEIQVVHDSIDKIEDKLIDEHFSEMKIFEDEKEIIRKLMKVLSQEKEDEQKVEEYEQEIDIEMNRIFNFQ